MRHASLLSCFTALALGASVSASGAQDTTAKKLPDTLEQVATHTGEMGARADAVDYEVQNSLRLEPFQLLSDMILRSDVVYLMRHGPTDWSKLDVNGVAPDDCQNQRIMSQQGQRDMQDLGVLLASNEIIPSEIVVSQWCRNQQTLANLMEGFRLVDEAIPAAMPVETDADVNLLLSLNGAKSVTTLRDRITNWEGHATRPGPLLIISHFTNIEELTQFTVFEGEILVIDPKRDNQVLGYIRLQTARPDVGHFVSAIESPLNRDERAQSMVARYYQALNTGDEAMFRDVLAERWQVHGTSPDLPSQGSDGFLATVARWTEGMSDSRFDVEDVHIADEVVTVRGTIRGTHTGMMFGVPATGNEISVGAIAVHRIEGDAIAESWHMADRLSLLSQIGAVPQPE